ncbi:hypothetical protein Peur_059047 [Populus x canadensis]
MGLLGAVFSIVNALVLPMLGPAIMLLYPAYASIQAIERPSHRDNKQWLSYWILYSFISLFEITFLVFLQWFPLWGLIKLLVHMWLVLPVFNGATFVYENYMRDYRKLNGFFNDLRKMIPGEGF